MTEQNERIINSSVKMLTISEDESGQRIDNYLLAKLKGVPKSLIYRIMRKGEVRVIKAVLSQSINCKQVISFAFRRCVWQKKTTRRFQKI